MPALLVQTKPFNPCSCKLMRSRRITHAHAFSSVQTRRFDATLLSQVDKINARYPWGRKRDVVFGRFSPYKRMAPAGLPGLLKKGAG